MKPDIAVIILNWNGEKLLREFLPQVIANTNADIADIIVADNGSTDGSVDLLHRDFPQLKTLCFTQNHGFAGGYNKAIAETRYRYTVLLNSDVAPAAGWLEALAGYMDSHPHTGGCQPKILSYTARPARIFEYAGASGGFIDKNGYPYCRGRIFDTCETDTGQYDTPMDVFWATGACLMVRTDAYLEVGGLDERFFAHMEEIDLCWRMQLNGYSIAVLPSAEVYHLGGGSLPASNPRKTYLNFRNNLLMMYKNLPEAVRTRRITTRMILDGIAALKFALTFDFGNVSAILRAHRDFRSMRKLYCNHPATDLLSPRNTPAINILKAYYLQGRRTFSALPR